MPPVLNDFSWDRMIAAVEVVKERMLLAAKTLEQAGAPMPSLGLQDIDEAGGDRIVSSEGLRQMKFTPSAKHDRSRSARQNVVDSTDPRTRR